MTNIMLDIFYYYIYIGCLFFTIKILIMWIYEPYLQWFVNKTSNNKFIDKQMDTIFGLYALLILAWPYMLYFFIKNIFNNDKPNT